jgi:LPXTG-site transpeptidase (sortase) family protein
MADELHGEMPTTGAARPGPAAGKTTLIQATEQWLRPIAIRIPSIQVDAEIERRPIVNGQMADPTGPFVVAWYGSTGRLGQPEGNVVLAGHVDYAGVGPAVFAQVGELAEGDEIEVLGESVKSYRYAVVWSKLYDDVTAPVDEIIGPTNEQSVTLITCGGTFDAASQRYDQRLIVRGERR